MRVQHPEEKIDIVRRLRDFESASRTGLCRCRDRFIVRRIREVNRERELARDEINCAESKRELFEKTPKNKEQRLSGLDLVIELVTFLKSFRRLNKFQWARGSPVRAFPKPNGLVSEPSPKFLFI
jgi:hypothetical protein